MPGLSESGIGIGLCQVFGIGQQLSGIGAIKTPRREGRGGGHLAIGGQQDMVKKIPACCGLVNGEKKGGGEPAPKVLGDRLSVGRMFVI